MNLHDVKNLTGRRGKWAVSERLVSDTIKGDQETRAAWHAAFGEAIVTHTEYRFGAIEIVYEGFHPAFEVVEPNMMAPEYEFQITRVTDEPHTVSFVVKWVRKDGAR